MKYEWKVTDTVMVILEQLDIVWKIYFSATRYIISDHCVSMAEEE